MRKHYFIARDTLYPPKLALTSPTSGGGSVGIVRSRTKTTEFSFVRLKAEGGTEGCTFLSKRGALTLREKSHMILVS
jgi:hypothetical protein